MRPLFLACVATIVALAGCGRHVPPPPPLDNPGRTLEARYDSLGLEEFLALDDLARADRSAAADDDFIGVVYLRERLREFRQMELMTNDDVGYGTQIISYDDNPNDELRVDDLIQKLHRAVNTDPTFTEGWLELAVLQDLIGDHGRAQRSCALGLRAVAHDRRDVDRVAAASALRLQAAWSCRDLGDQRGGLDWLDAPASDFGERAQESILVRGLLLADAGRFRDAFKASMDLGAIHYPYRSYQRRGAGSIGSGYGRAWIQAAAWMAKREPMLARHALGVTLPTRTDVPFMRRYWNDVGLVHESLGDAKAASDAYGLALVGERIMLPYVPWDGFNMPPLIHGAPDVEVPYFTVYESNYFAGSRFAFAAQLVVETAAAYDPVARATRARDADQALTLCMNRGIRPVLSRALRGRARYYAGDLAGAEGDLRWACSVLDSLGSNDAGSCVVLGTILLNDGRHLEASNWLERAVVAEPELAGAWRTYGASLAVGGRRDDALAAMDRAIDLDPASSSAWFNRGLLQMEMGRWTDAVVDLSVTTRLAPWNRKAVDLIQQAGGELRASGRGDELAVADARAVSLADGLDIVAEGGVEERPGVFVLGGERSEWSAHAWADPEAAVDSLATVHHAAPTAENRRALADALIRCGRGAEALILLSEAWSLEMPSEDLILLLRADRDGADAARALTLVGQLGGTADRPDPEVWSLVAMTCLDQGHRDAGLRALERAIVLDPDNTGLRTYREFLLAAPPN